MAFKRKKDSHFSGKVEFEWFDEKAVKQKSDFSITFSRPTQQIVETDEFTELTRTELLDQYFVSAEGIADESGEPINDKTEQLEAIYEMPEAAAAACDLFFRGILSPGSGKGRKPYRNR